MIVGLPEMPVEVFACLEIDKVPKVCVPMLVKVELPLTGVHVRPFPATAIDVALPTMFPTCISTGTAQPLVPEGTVT